MRIEKLYPVIIIAFGILVLIKDEPLRKGSFYYDFTEIKYFVAPFLIIYGLIWLYFACRRKR